MLNARLSYSNISKSVLFLLMAMGILLNLGAMLEEPSPATFKTLQCTDGKVLEYALVLPHDYNPKQAYPILLALPPGPQNRKMVEYGLLNMYSENAIKYGWIVVSPIAPDGQLFFQGSEKYLPELLDTIASTYKAEGGKFHISGISNGGRSAFRIALMNPERFHSMLVMPGYPGGKGELGQLEKLKDISIAMYVGELDGHWLEAMNRASEKLTEFKIDHTYELLKGEDHYLTSMYDGKKAFRFFESERAADH